MTSRRRASCRRPFPVRLDDTPAFKSYPGEGGQVRYEEGVFVGYRWYDARAHRARASASVTGSRTPRSSSTHRRFRPRGRRSISLPAGATVRVGVRVRNSGARRGAEVVQCYVHDAEASVDRPVHELKAFAKVWLEPGATDEVTWSSTAAHSRSGTSIATTGRSSRASSSFASERRHADRAPSRAARQRG